MNDDRSPSNDERSSSKIKKDKESPSKNIGYKESPSKNMDEKTTLSKNIDDKESPSKNMDDKTSPSKKISEKRSPSKKQKRRSSFAVSRISVLQNGASSGELYKDTDSTKPLELYKDIDSTKSPDERLAMLHKICLQHTLNRMEKEATGSTCRDFVTYRREVEEAVYRKIADMEVNQNFKEATERRRKLPNPINIEMENAIENIQDKLTRLKEESKKWEELVDSPLEKIAEYERLPTQISEDDVPQRIKDKSSPYLRPRLDYGSILTDIDQNCKKIYIKELEHAEIVSKLNLAIKHASWKLNKHMEELRESQKPEETPRRIIQSLMSFPTPHK